MHPWWTEPRWKRSRAGMRSRWHGHGPGWWSRSRQGRWKSRIRWNIRWINGGHPLFVGWWSVLLPLPSDGDTHRDWRAWKSFSRNVISTVALLHCFTATLALLDSSNTKVKCKRAQTQPFPFFVNQQSITTVSIVKTFSLGKLSLYYNSNQLNGLQQLCLWD